MVVPIEDYLKYNKVVTPVQYIEAGQERTFTMFISCKEYLEEVADITEYVEQTLFSREFASVTVKFRKDCLLVFEEKICQVLGESSIEYFLWEVVNTLETEGRANNEKH